MYMAVVFNAPSMEHAKERYQQNRYDGSRWQVQSGPYYRPRMPGAAFGDMIEVSITEAKAMNDRYPPRIFVVKD